MERAENRADVVAWYREFEPHPALQDRVRALFSFTSLAQPIPSRRVIFQMTCGAGDACPSPTFADANASVVFDLGTTFHPDGRWRENALAVGGKIIGAMRRARPHPGNGLPAAVGAYILPGQLQMLVHVPAGELTDFILPLESLWGDPAADLASRLATLDESARLDLLEHALLRRNEARHRTSAVDVRRLAACIVRLSGRVSIDDLAAAAGVSRQQLTRVFQERVGVSPKQYCRLARFQSTLGKAHVGEAADWARVAFEAGYADQSHMIAEFREFTSLTPHMLATERWLHPFIERARQQGAARAVLERD